MQLKAVFLHNNRPSKKSLGKLFLLGALAAYMLYHLFHGNRGLFALFEIRQVVSQERELVEQLRNEKSILLRDIRLLRPQSLDLDLLEERARDVLSLAGDGEIVVNASDFDVDGAR
ncbi:MAG: septum formation initiator family protein [Holosporales bacterium]|jgi:cell division protein FtsB|nr:septum formation initiator family protein [Holosporales bacterium]